MKAAVLYSSKMKEYDLGHVLTGERFDEFLQLFKEKLGDDPNIQLVEPPYATDDDLRLIHTDDYIRRIERLESRDPLDTPLSPGLVRAAKLLAGAGKLAGELIQSKRFNKAFVIGGGVQHARRDHEKGFGVFSDVGICAENLMSHHGVKRILVLDTDAHAGDGIYSIFSRDPRVLFISIHQDPRTLYPGTGFVHQIGEMEGEGYSVNVPLLPGTSDVAYRYVLDNIFIPLAREFRPELILMVDGSDPHFTDRITQMALTLEGIYMIGQVVRNTADEVCQGKVVDFPGSGYSYKPEIVSMGWLASIAGVTGIEFEIDKPIPLPHKLKRDQWMLETKLIVKAVQEKLAPFWKCFNKSTQHLEQRVVITEIVPLK